MKIFCIIPAYNEENHVYQVITKVKPYVSEVILVNDNSKDRTAELALEAGATLISHPINRGQGAALETGQVYALKQGADIVLHFDADDQFLAKEIPSMLEPIINGSAQAVLGSRFLGKESNLPNFKRKVLLPMAKLFNRVFFKIKFTDPQNGFRALSKEVLLKIKIENDGMAHCSEIMHKLTKLKIPTTEVPVTVVYHEFGQNLSGGFKIIKESLIKKIIK